MHDKLKLLINQINTINNMTEHNQHLTTKLSDFLLYLAEFSRQGGSNFPSLSELSNELGVSVSTIREQLQVAKSLGLVDIKPRTGIRILEYSFSPALTTSLAYSICLDRENFDLYADLRKHVEIAYWYLAVSKLTFGDLVFLKECVSNAQKKLMNHPIQIPQVEHRDLHITIFKRLENKFVTGILETYWDLYEAVGLNYYEDRSYLENVWQYHKQIVESIETSNFELGYQLMIDHMDLIQERKKTDTSSLFE
ncbi:MAG: FCD domain-containing protein [Anaerolineaceae bacterium]|nr:FCD domain-containing protein [Anaerolineaceae bacterium]